VIPIEKMTQPVYAAAEPAINELTLELADGQ